MNELNKAESLEVRIAKCEARLKNVIEELNVTHKSKNTLSRKIAVLEKDMSITNIELMQLKELSIIEQGIPNEVAELRNSILSKMELAQRGDITIKTKKKTEDEIKKLKAGLQDICEHPFILSYPGYAGSYSHDYEDGYYGTRFCAVCDYFEKSQLKERNEYPVLKEERGRIIRYDTRKENGRPFIWAPFGVLLEMFRNSTVKQSGR